MSNLVEVYYPDSTEIICVFPLLEVLRCTTARILGQPVDSLRFFMKLQPVYDEFPTDPDVYNLNPEFGFADIYAARDGQIIYRHPHTMGELMAESLRTLMKQQYPELKRFGYLVSGPDIPRLPLTLPKPQVAFAAQQKTEGAKPALNIRRMPDEPLPEATLDDFGVRSGSIEPSEASLKVVIPAQLAESFLSKRTYSDKVEEGGFLVGKAYRNRNLLNGYIVHVTNEISAQHTGASLVHLTFTGDSFTAVKQRLRSDFEGKVLTGWHHSHLFPATGTMGLSSIDYRLHFNTFLQPWQLAALVNLDGGDQRTLRFYSRKGEMMMLCPYFICDHSATDDRDVLE